MLPVALAAAAAIALALAFWRHWPAARDRGQSPLPTEQATEMRSLRLPDSSQVKLNAGSEIVEQFCIGRAPGADWCEARRSSRSQRTRRGHLSCRPARWPYAPWARPSTSESGPMRSKCWSRKARCGLIHTRCFERGKNRNRPAITPRPNSNLSRPGSVRSSRSLPAENRCRPWSEI